MGNSRPIQRKGADDDGYTLCIPLSSIERIYGPGNFDASEEDIAQAVWDSGGSCGGVNYEMDIDSSHENPWFHSLLLTVKGLSPDEFGALRERMVGLKLLEEAGQPMAPEGNKRGRKKR